MSGNERAGGRILGSLGSADGKGVVRMEDRFDTDIDDVWSALTDPSRLARWYGEVQGDLRLGGEFRVRVLASGWEGTGRVEACEPPRRLVVTGKEPDQPGGDVSEVTLATDGDQTILVLDCPWTSLPPTGRRPRSMSKTSAPTSPGASAAMPTRGWRSFFLPIRTWRPTLVRHWLLPD
ncbi:MAG TPA: SRPBCC domain-containing protein [Pseudonocardiaceae bacterium]|nr:SRPBCC domain-containing protein [Pseudonocardiaceae bacterium]